ncbi:MAG: site-specific integrase [Bacteroidetes bacterium]|nr:site-specific integrase [Bacteroidota bacterium]
MGTHNSSRQRNSNSTTTGYVTINPTSDLIKCTQPFRVEGRTTWYVKISVRSSRTERWRHLKRSTGVLIGSTASKKAARIAAIQMLANFQVEHDPTASRKLSTFLAAYIQECEARNLSKQYLTQVRAAATALLKAIDGGTLLTHIKVSTLRSFFNSVRSASVALSYYRCLHAAFARAVVDGDLDHNPFVRADKRALKERLNPRPRGIMRPEQIFAIHAAMPRGTYLDRLSASLMLVLFGEGVRRSEACFLKVEDFDTGTMRVSIRPKPEYRLKNRASAATIPLTSPAERAFRDQLQNRDQHPNESVRTSAWLFCNERGEHYHPDSITKAVLKRVRSVCESLGLKIDGMDLHSFRHSTPQNLVEGGINPALVSRMIRHSSLQTTLSTYHKNSDSSVPMDPIIDRMRTWDLQRLHISSLLRFVFVEDGSSSEFMIEVKSNVRRANGNRSMRSLYSLLGFDTSSPRSGGWPHATN